MFLFRYTHHHVSPLDGFDQPRNLFRGMLEVIVKSDDVFTLCVSEAGEKRVVLTVVPKVLD